MRLNNARALVYAMPKSTQASEACDWLARSGDPVDATLAPKMNGAIGALIAAFSSLCGRMSGDDDRITYVVDHIVEAPPAHPSAPPWAYAAALCSQEQPVPVTAVFQAVLRAEVPWALRWFRSLEAPGQLAPVLPELLELEARGLEDLLIYLLEDGGLSSRHVVAIIGELARVGTVGSIPQLRTHCDEFRDPPGPKDAARDAIDAIRARVPGAEVGQLAVVGEDPKQGGLSETPE